MTRSSTIRVARKSRTVLTPSDPEEFWDLAERLNGRPVPNLRLTEQQFVKWCPEEVTAEWVGGEVILIHPSTPAHNNLSIFLAIVVEGFAEDRDLGNVFTSAVQVRLEDIRRRRVPDIAFIAATRSRLITETCIDGPPDLIVEVVSPDSVSRDWVDKRDDYLRAGVREYWIVDPRHEQFVTFSLHGKTYRTIQPDEQGRVPSRVLKGLYIRPAWLWRSPLPKVSTVLKELGVR